MYYAVCTMYYVLCIMNYVLCIMYYVLFNKLAVRVLSGLKHEAIAECFIPDKTRTASLLNGFKNEPLT